MANGTAKNPAKPVKKFADVNMAVMVTLVFADEAHRAAWLIGNGFIAPDKTPLEKYNDPSFDTLDARRLDFTSRRHSQNLIYTVGPLNNGEYVKKRPRKYGK